MEALAIVPAGGLMAGNLKQSSWRSGKFFAIEQRRQVCQPGRTFGIVAVATPPVKEAQALQYKQLGDSDLVISEVTLGTMTWGNQNTEKDGHEQLAYAFDQGINILDTAEAYPVPMSKDTHGRTDEIIGSWLKSMPRDKVVVATKMVGFSNRCGHLRDDGEFTRVDRKNIKESVEKSLKRLQVDYIDLFQIHWPDRYVPLFGKISYDSKYVRESIPFQEQLQAFQELIQEGKIRHIGVANETSYGVMQFLRAAETFGLPKIVSIQNSYSLVSRCHFEVDLIEVCSPGNGNVGLLAYSPLGGGILTGKYADPEKAKTGRLSLFPGLMNRYDNPVTREAADAYVKIAKRHGITPSQLALAFCRDRPFLTTTLVGATTLDQLKEDTSAFQLPRPLVQEINDDIETVFKKYRDPSIF